MMKNKLNIVQKISKRVLLFVAIASTAFVLQGSVDMVAHAGARTEACDAIGGNMDAGVCVTTGPSVNKAISAVINTLSVMVGIVAVIMLIFGGFRYVTSGGDANAAKTARSTISYALVGIVVAALAQAIVQFVLTKV